MGALRGTSVRAEVRDLLDGSYVATYTATRAGRYQLQFEDAHFNWHFLGS